MRRLRRTTPEIRLDITPLIDVVFLLLTFFIFSMLLMVRADALDITLPGVSSGRPAERISVVRVAMAADGSVTVNDEAVELSLVPQAVLDARTAAGDNAAPVRVAVDAAASAADLIRLADALSGAGLGEFSLIGRPAASPAPAAP
jgi:biopolymer transport protein ExbD